MVLGVFAGLALGVQPVCAEPPKVRLILGAPTYHAGKVNLAFKVQDLATGGLIKDTDLEVSHTQLLHLFIFDQALKVFRHEHPKFHNGYWFVQVPEALTRNGNYRVWADATKKGGEEITGFARFAIHGGLAPNPVVALPEVREGADRGSGTRIKGPPKLYAGADYHLLLDFFLENSTKPPVITEYMGAMAHIVIVPTQADQMVHVHPHMMGNQFAIHVNFPRAGVYRAWVQFIESGVLRVVPLSFHVEAQ